MIKIIDGIDENGKPKKFRLEIPMKYIRTKEGRVLRLIEKCEYKENEITYIVGWDWEDNFEINQEDTIKIADTIEELCDVIVCGTKLFYSLTTENGLSKFNWNEIKEYCYRCNIKNIKGAIWTDKGLIYVAKMNEKGELELI